MGIKYRPEIDGLRTLAVGSVIIYHMKLEVGGVALLPGGYLGVDIFFVLSGFLITSILLKELEDTGRVSLKKFYLRRAKRILPPLFLVILVSLPVAYTILLPSELERFSFSIWAALGFFSNGFWYLEQGEYGAQSALLQPFLHTWSLAIEEQFYVIFPVLLAVTYRFRVGLVIFSLIMLSLFVSEVTTYYKEDLSFFSPFSRAWELLAGSFLAWGMKHRSGRRGQWPFENAIPSVSIFSLFLAMIFLPLGRGGHPGLITLPVILATCGLLWYSKPEEPITKLLSTHIFVFFGKLSYSLYLWHFPVFAFGRLHFGNPDAIEISALLFFTIFISVLGYYVVERPFRFRTSPRILFCSMLGALCLVGYFSATVHLSGGMPSRFMAEGSPYVGHDFDNEKLRDESWSILDGLSSDPPLGSQGAREASRHEREDLWFSGSDNLRLLVVGNSHSKDVFNALYINRSTAEGFEVARYALGSNLGQDTESLILSPNFRNSDAVIFAHRFDSTALSQLITSIDIIQGAGKSVILLGSADEFPLQAGRNIFDWFAQRNLGAEDLREMNKFSFSKRSGLNDDLDQELISVAKNTGASFLSREGIVCSEEMGTCTLISSSGRKTMYDDNHWTLEGARVFGQRMVEAGWITKFGELKMSTQSLEHEN